MVDVEDQLRSLEALRFPLSHFLLAIARQSWTRELARLEMSPIFLRNTNSAAHFRLQQGDRRGKENQTSKRERLP